MTFYFQCPKICNLYSKFNVYLIQSAKMGGTNLGNMKTFKEKGKKRSEKIPI